MADETEQQPAKPPLIDTKTRQKYRDMGAAAKRKGRPLEHCPYTGQYATWWREGWDRAK